MSDIFESPSLVTPNGTKVVISASPTGGLSVSSRHPMGAESSATIPADVALAVLANADQLATALTVVPVVV